MPEQRAGRNAVRPTRPDRKQRQAGPPIGEASEGGPAMVLLCDGGSKAGRLGPPPPVRLDVERMRE